MERGKTRARRPVVRRVSARPGHEPALGIMGRAMVFHVRGRDGNPYDRTQCQARHTDRDVGRGGSQETKRAGFFEVGRATYTMHDARCTMML